jgi:hypothetical protein
MRGSLPREKLDAKGNVICQICGKPFMSISPKHLKNHNLSYAEYFLRYPDAPACNAEFGARTKYRKDRNAVFTEQMNVKKETIKINNDLGDEIIISDEVGEPEMMDIDPMLERLTEQVKSLNPLDRDKIKILNWLRMYFSNMQKDYMIQIINILGLLQFETISDFADPVLKINIEFPNAFWHNMGRCNDPLRDVRLEENGWKVINIKSKNPSLIEIEEAVKKV